MLWRLKPQTGSWLRRLKAASAAAALGLYEAAVSDTPSEERNSSVGLKTAGARWLRRFSTEAQLLTNAFRVSGRLYIHSSEVFQYCPGAGCVSEFSASTQRALSSWRAASVQSQRRIQREDGGGEGLESERTGVMDRTGLVPEKRVTGSFLCSLYMIKFIFYSKYAHVSITEED